MTVQRRRWKRKLMTRWIRSAKSSAKSLLLTLCAMLILYTAQGYGIPLTLPDGTSGVFLTDSEWDQMEAEIDLAVKVGIEEAVKLATDPLRVEIRGLEVERDGWRAEVKNDQFENILYTLAGVVVGGGIVILARR